MRECDADADGVLFGGAILSAPGVPNLSLTAAQRLKRSHGRVGWYSYRCTLDRSLSAAYWAYRLDVSHLDGEEQWRAG
jgi:hypothetical protein